MDATARPRNKVSITKSRVDQSAAAAILSQTLWDLECPHAFIGGFAWALLGSPRFTEIMHDIDVLIELKDRDICDLRRKLEEFSKQFASLGVKLYYVKELKDDLVGEELVRASRSNVLIETLQAGSWGLPIVVEPRYPISVENESGFVLEVLHPGVLLLTKMKRWYHSRESTRPQTVAKRLSDKSDLDYLVHFLAEKEMTIEFDKYQGKTKGELLEYVRAYTGDCIENEELMKALKAAMKSDDWGLLSSLISIPDSGVMVATVSVTELE